MMNMTRIDMQLPKIINWLCCTKHIYNNLLYYYYLLIIMFIKKRTINNDICKNTVGYR